MSISSLQSSSLYANSGYNAQRTSPFAQADTDGSNSVSFEEFAALGQNLPGEANSAERQAEMFSKIDTDGDGLISVAEDAAFQSQMTDQMQSAMLNVQEQFGSAAASDIFAEFDTDGDGSITEEELSTALGLDGDEVSQLFAEVDTDGDGLISEAENQAHLEAQKSQRAGGPPPGGGGGPSDEEDDEDTLSGIEALMDTNGDGEVSSTEMNSFFSSLETFMTDTLSKSAEASKAYSNASLLSA